MPLVNYYYKTLDNKIISRELSPKIRFIQLSPYILYKQHLGYKIAFNTIVA